MAPITLPISYPTNADTVGEKACPLACWPDFTLDLCGKTIHALVFLHSEHTVDTFHVSHFCKSQEVAPSGCSCKKYRTLDTCNHYSCMQNLTFSSATRFLSLKAFFHPSTCPNMWMLRFCSRLNFDQGRDPTNSHGSSRMVVSMAFRLSALREKPQPVLRSMDRPRTNPILLAIWTIEAERTPR